MYLQFDNSLQGGCTQVITLLSTLGGAGWKRSRVPYSGISYAV